MRALVAIVVAAVAVTAVGVRPAAQVPAREHISEVRVDVVAADAHGHSVENLQPSDFELSENGAPHAIDAVRFIKVNSGGDQARLVAIFLDEYHVSAVSTDLVRGALMRFVDRDLGPRDLVAVLKPLDSLLAIRMTRD